MTIIIAKVLLVLWAWVLTILGVRIWDISKNVTGAKGASLIVDATAIACGLTAAFL